MSGSVRRWGVVKGGGGDCVQGLMMHWVHAISTFPGVGGGGH